MKWTLLIWVLFCLGIQILLQRLIRQQLFSLSYRLTSRPESTLRLFGCLMFPGTLLHELSHILAASVLGSRIWDVSLSPTYVEDENGKGTVELGSVMAKDVGVLRNAMISVAPTVAGSLLILLVGWLVFDLPGVAAALETGAWDQVMACVTTPLGTVWGWVGVSVIIIASVNMLPSPTDAQSAVGLIFLPIPLIVVLAILYLTRSTIMGAFVEFTNTALSWLSVVLCQVL